MRIWISQCPNRLISAFKDFEYLEKTGDIDGTSITQMNEAVLDYYTTVMLPNAANNLTASGVEETRNRFVVPGPPPSSASRRMGPPTPGGLSSAGEISAVESASEFNAGFLKHINKRRRVIPMIGSTINFNYQECSSRNNKKESIIMAIKYHKNIVENSTSQLVTYLKSFQQTDDVSGMKHWDGEFRKYAAKSLLKMGNISCEEFVEYCKRGGAKELSSDMLEIKRRQKQSESQERPTKRRKYFHGTSRRNKEIYDLSSESEDSDDTTKKQLTGLPTKNDRSNSSHTEAMARDYLTKSNIIVEPKGKGINGNKNKICYELPLTKWPYIPKDKKGRSYVPGGLEHPKRGRQLTTELEMFIYNCLTDISDKAERDRKEKTLKGLRTRILKRSIRSIPRQENKECQDPTTINEIIATIQDIDPILTLWNDIPRKVRTKVITLMHYRVIASACLDLFYVGWNAPSHINVDEEPINMAIRVIKMGYRKYRIPGFRDTSTAPTTTIYLIDNGESDDASSASSTATTTTTTTATATTTTTTTTTTTDHAASASACTSASASASTSTSTSTSTSSVSASIVDPLAAVIPTTTDHATSASAYSSTSTFTSASTSVVDPLAAVVPTTTDHVASTSISTSIVDPLAAVVSIATDHAASASTSTSIDDSLADVILSITGDSSRYTTATDHATSTSISTTIVDPLTGIFPTTTDHAASASTSTSIDDSLADVILSITGNSGRCTTATDHANSTSTSIGDSPAGGIPTTTGDSSRCTTTTTTTTTTAIITDHAASTSTSASIVRLVDHMNPEIVTYGEYSNGQLEVIVNTNETCFESPIDNSVNWLIPITNTNNRKKMNKRKINPDGVHAEEEVLLTPVVSPMVSSPYTGGTPD